MRNICVNFETWTIEDGSYSPMNKGDTRVFAIGISAHKHRISIKKKKYLIQKKNANYLFSGEVLYNNTTNDTTLIVVNTGVFKFFISGYDTKLELLYKVGQFIEGEGVLSIDSYLWMHEWYVDGAPHIYCDYSVENIMGSKMAFEPYRKSLGDEDDEYSSEYMVFPELDEDNLIEMNNVLDDDMMLSHVELKMIKVNESPGGYTLHDGDKKFPFGYRYSQTAHKNIDLEPE